MTISDTTTRPTRSRWVAVLSWVPRIALALVFAGAGFSKIAGEPAMIELFSAIGAGQGLRYVVGTLEIAGAIGVLVPLACGLAAAGLALLMIGASIVNVAVLGVSPAFTLFMFALAVVTVWLRRHQLRPWGAPAREAVH